MQEQKRPSSWQDEDEFWRTTFGTRPYTSSAPDYEVWQGAYRYGYESAHRHHGREWHEVEPELSRGWSEYAHRGESAWQHVKSAVRDAWDRAVNHSVVTK